MDRIEVEADREPLFFGWDVGAWHCDRKGDSQDTLVALDASGETVGEPWRKNLRGTINAAATSVDFVQQVLNLCGIDREASRSNVTIAIDAPLGFPEAFSRLILDGLPFGDVGEKAGENPYLYRVTERRLIAEGVIRPLSTIQDRIGSQATKAIHAVARFATVRESLGIWTDGACLTMIETYPALCQKRLGLWEGSKRKGISVEESDLRDAKICAKVARDFQMNRDILEHPTEDAPCSEGWIWAPLGHMEAAQN